MFAAAAATTIHSLQRRPFLNKERARDKELFSSPQQKTSKFILYKKKVWRWHGGSSEKKYVNVEATEKTNNDMKF